MEELNDMARELLAERIRIVRAAIEMEAPGDWRERNKNHMERMDAIMCYLPDSEREWLDEHLYDGMMISEEECTALYMAGLKDGLKLFKQFL